MDDNMTLLILAVLLASLAIVLLRLRRRKAPGTAYADFVMNQPKAEPPRIESHKAHPQRPRVDRQQFDLPKIVQPMIEQPRMANQVMEQPALTNPVINRPVMANPAINQPVMTNPIIERPVVANPIIEQPVVANPIIEQPVVANPIIEQPVVANPNLSQQYVTQARQEAQTRQEAQKGEPPKVDMQKTEPQKTEQLVKVPEVDQNVLDQLREAGSDLSKPHDLEFYLYFPDQEAAGIAAERIKASGAGGFAAEVKRAPQGDVWMCYVTRKMVPEGAKIALIGERFRALAQELGGEYDGWETSLVK